MLGTNTKSELVKLKIVEIHEEDTSDDNLQDNPHIEEEDDNDAINFNLPQTSKAGKTTAKLKNFRRTRTCVKRHQSLHPHQQYKTTKNNSQSCGSLYSLAPIRPMNDENNEQQRSVPNVNLYSNCISAETSDLNIHFSNLNDELKISSNTLDDAPVLDDSLESLRASQNYSTLDFNATQDRPNGFSNTMITFLQKIVFWRNSVPPSRISSQKLNNSNKGSFYISSGSQHFRTIYGGNFHYYAKLISLHVYIIFKSIDDIFLKFNYLNLFLLKLIHYFSLLFPENERKIRANDREYNLQFRYAVS